MKLIKNKIRPSQNNPYYRSNQRINRKKLKEIKNKISLFKSEELEVSQINLGENYIIELKSKESGSILITAHKERYKNSQQIIEGLQKNREYLKIKAIATIEAIFQSLITDNCKSGKKIHLQRLIHALKRPLASLAGMHVHHTNGESLDNRAENLTALEASEHVTLHKIESILGILPILINGENLQKAGHRQARHNRIYLGYMVQDGFLYEPAPIKKQKKSHIFKRGSRMERFTKNNIIPILEEFSLINRYVLVKEATGEQSGSRLLALSSNYTGKLCLELGLELSKPLQNTITRRLKEAMESRGYTSKTKNLWQSCTLVQELEKDLKLEEVENKELFPLKDLPLFSGKAETEITK